MRIATAERRSHFGGATVPAAGRQCAALFAAAVLAAVLAGCSGGLAPVDSRDGYGPAPPGYYRIRRGDTLSEIAERKRIPMRKLAAWNGLRQPYSIYAGGLLRVKPPAGGSPAPAVARNSRPASGAGVARPVKTKAAPAAKPGSGGAASGIAWQWPLRGPLKQGFRSGDRTRQGIRIGASPGTPVAAAADGTVVYSGSGLKGYGNLIIVKHDSRYLSAYGFNQRLLASEGDRVKRGQQLAEAGRSADGQPLLHFEIRKDGTAVDPLIFLPASR